MKGLKNFILETKLGNTDENGKMGNAAFDTQDRVFLESYDEIKNTKDNDRVAYYTHYSYLNRNLPSERCLVEDGKKCGYWLRSAYDKNAKNVMAVGTSAMAVYGAPSNDEISICPALNLNLSAVLAGNLDDFKIEEVKDEYGNTIYHTIQLGTYPQGLLHIGSKTLKTLKELYAENKLTFTGKTYIGFFKKDGTFQRNPEFELNGKKYVRFVSRSYDLATSKNYETYRFVEVQPIKWIIKNWNDLPKEINPNGNGTAKSISVRSLNGLITGVPFNLDNKKIAGAESAMWQNSFIRAYLNDYDLMDEIAKGNGNKNFRSFLNYSFNKGFLYEAFDDSNTLSAKKDEDAEFEL